MGLVGESAERNRNVNGDEIMEAKTNPGLRPIEIRQFDAPLGAEVLGVDLEKVDDALFAAIHAALLEHQVLVFRGQNLSEDGQLSLSRCWGKIRSHMLKRGTKLERPELLVLTNLDAEGRPKGEHPDPGSAIWHTDGSWTKQPSVISMLYALEIPKSGGDTLFADMYGAYERLPAATKSRIERLSALHDLDYARRLGGALQPMTEEQRKAAPPVEHPIVARHPETNRPVIYLGEYGTHIAGLPHEEGLALIREINAHATGGAHIFRHHWKLHDVVIWDNRCVLHRVTDFDWTNDRRAMRRSTVTAV
jgi:taurine dioxygenase